MSRSGLRALRRLETTFAGRCARSFLALQGIDSAEIIDTVHARRPPVVPVNSTLRP